jgi:glycosyltransferase involved in cell wall biosynthesis
VKDSAVRSLRISDGDVTVIERGRDPDRLGLPGSDRRAAARQMLGLSEDDQVLLTVGRQEFQKGQIYLVEAMPEIVRRHPRAILLLAGRAGQASDDLRLAHEESAVQSHIRFLGHRNDIPELLAAADAFVFPSLYEGLGGAVIEAMALDLPIVASDVPAIREVVEDGRNALLVKSGSPSAIADAVAVLLADQDRRNTFAKRSGEIFRDRFTLQRSATRMVKLYENLVQGRTRSSAIVAQRVSGPPADRTNATV